MTNKSAEEVTQNLENSGTKRKMDSIEIKNDLNIYQNPSKKPRNDSNKTNESTIHEEKVSKCSIYSKSCKTSCKLKQHIVSVHGSKKFKCTFVHQFSHKKAT